MTNIKRPSSMKSIRLAVIAGSIGLMVGASLVSGLLFALATLDRPKPKYLTPATPANHYPVRESERATMRKAPAPPSIPPGGEEAYR